MAVRASLEGVNAVIRRLESVKRGLRNRILRKALTKAAQPLAKNAKWLAPVSHDPPLRPGLLRKAIGYKVKTYSKSGVSVAMIGARRGFRVQVGIRQYGKNAGKPIYQDPVKYDHLVEYGSAHSRALPFLRPAWDGGKAGAEATVATIVREGIAEAAQ